MGWQLDRRVPAVATLLLIVLLAAGCTARSTDLAIREYERTSQLQQQAFEQAISTAVEQLYVASQQHLSQHPDQAAATLEVAFRARQGLESLRVQWERAAALQRLTVGQYLYNQRGWLDVMLESYMPQWFRQEKP